MSTNARDTILTAAGRLIAREDACRLTLGNVAAEARLSTGAGLYHFGTKDDLIRRVVETLVAQFDTELVTNSAPGTPGAWTRACLQTTVSETGSETETPVSGLSPRLGPALTRTGIAAAVADKPAHLEPVCPAHHRWQQNIENDLIDPLDATTVRLSNDGLQFSDLIGLGPLPEPLNHAVVSRLRAMTISAHLTET